MAIVNYDDDAFVLRIHNIQRAVLKNKLKPRKKQSQPFFKFF